MKSAFLALEALQSTIAKMEMQARALLLLCSLSCLSALLCPSSVGTCLARVSSNPPSSFFANYPTFTLADSVLSNINEGSIAVTSEQIDSYVNNIGGGVCGDTSKWKPLIGAGLNYSLILFAVLIATYGEKPSLTLWSIINDNYPIF
jgi:hypothetical protein